MKYMLLIHQGSAPTPYDPEAWGRLSEDEQKEVYAAYQAINETPGVSPGLQLQPPAATTVRVEDGKTLVTDDPFVAVKGSGLPAFRSASLRRICSRTGPTRCWRSST